MAPKWKPAAAGARGGASFGDDLPDMPASSGAASAFARRDPQAPQKETTPYTLVSLGRVNRSDVCASAAPPRSCADVLGLVHADLHHSPRRYIAPQPQPHEKVRVAKLNLTGASGSPRRWT